MNQTHTSKAILFGWFLCGLGALFYCYEYLLRISPSVMTEELMRFYHLTGAQYGNLSGSFYYYSYVLMQVIVGLLMDRYGPRRLLTMACLLCVAGAYLFACSDSIAIAMIGRFLVGFGSAFAFVGAGKIATIWLPPHRFALVAGIIFCLGMLGAVFGDIVLQMLVNSTGWRTTTFGAAAVGLGLAAVLWLFIRDVNPYYVNHHSHQTMTLPEVVSGLALACRNPQIWLCGITGCLLYVFLTGFAELWGPVYLQQAQGLTRAHAANANSFIFLGCALGAPFWGWFSDLIQRRRIPVFVGGSISLIITCILLYSDTLSLPMIYGLLFVFGFFGSVQILMFAIGREMTSIKISGTTIGLLNALIMIGGVAFPYIIGKVLDLNWTGTLIDGARIYTGHAYTIALTILPVSFILALIATCFIRETRCRIFVEEQNHP